MLEIEDVKTPYDSAMINQFSWTSN